MIFFSRFDNSQGRAVKLSEVTTVTKVLIFLVLAHFHSVNIPTTTDFKLPLSSLNINLGEDAAPATVDQKTTRKWSKCLQPASHAKSHVSLQAQSRTFF